MTYQETIEFLEISNWMGSRLGLSRMQELLHLLGDPHKQLKYVHITGTNGKGSTAAMLESVLRAAGYHTGLYTSPHLIRYNERMKIDGRNVSDEDMQHAADLMAVQIEKMEDKPTVFERITVMALLIFALKKCEIVVLEVGLGGRLDATNVIEAPECSVITNMDLEHTQVLGNTIEEIAAEKAGIIKPGCPVVLYAQSEAAESVVKAKAAECGSRFFRTDPSKIRVLSRSLKGQIFDYRQRKNVRIALPGNYQLRNASTVLDTVDVLTSRG
ncbi:MAG: bifunctional folylpolyglutamate synthase/dihydrofolate synthase, partial [Firmicutes bacterium]|nr:bifunctional folylpolyglutamate synthase/dihydrofolate synthase [Bacillota bacterium]